MKPNSSSVPGVLPAHVGIIMDGNRRWAKAKMLPVALGHKKGAEVFRERVADLAAFGVENATFYAFSTENFNRSEGEVADLMRLFETQLSELENHSGNENIRIRFIGDLSPFGEELREKCRLAEERTAANTGLVCRIALNYGGRAEIVRAAQALAVVGEAESATPESFSRLMYTWDAPDVDLIIRTGGEMRLSNFLLWQSAYAELYFTDTLWCDFSRRELEKALEEFAARERRHGR